MKKHILKISCILSMISLFSVGFASWYIDGKIENKTSTSGTIETGDTEISSRSYYDLKLTKTIKKSYLENVATPKLNNSNSIEIFDSTFKWSSKDSSKYSSPLSTYFDLYDSNNPIGDSSPRLINLDSNDTIRLPMHTLDSNAGTLTSSIYYSNSYHILDKADSSSELSSAEVTYDANDEKNATNQVATIETTTNISTGLSNCRLDIRRFVKNSKYYSYKLYLFYYTNKTPKKIERTVLTPWQFNSFSNALTNSDWPTISNAKYTINDKKSASTISGTLGYTANDGSAKTITVTFSTACYTSASEYYSKSIDDTASNYSIYRKVNKQMPLYSYANVASSTSSDIIWTCGFKYFREEEKNMVDSGTRSIKTPIGYKYVNATLREVNQISNPLIVFNFVNENDESDTLERTSALSVGTRPKSYLYKELNWINRDDITLEYVIRLIPKANYIENAKEIIDSFNYSIEYNMRSKVI